MSLESELVRQVSNLQKQVDGLIKPEVSRWMDWTPTITQSVSVTRTVNFARYTRIGKLVIAKGHLAVTSNGTAGTAITIGGLPINAANVGLDSNADGDWSLRDASVPNNYAGTVRLFTSTTFLMRDSNSTGGGIGAVPNLGLANGDTIGFTVIYEST